MKNDIESTTSHVVRGAEGEEFDVLGAHLVWKARGNDTDGTFTVAVQNLSPNEVIPKHKHQYPEVFYVVHGEVEFTLFHGLEGVKEIVRGGDTVVVAADAYHSFQNLSESVATLLDISTFEHQLFFDDVQIDAAKWGDLTPEEAMQRVGRIGMKHTFEFSEP
jgi:quercetin dioxygenase-like cupin family protein